MLEHLERKIREGYAISYAEAVELAEAQPLEALCALAGRLKRHFDGAGYEACSIMNARSGRCGEDCKWCSQSAHHAARVDIYPLVGADEAVALAAQNAAQGVRRFSLVTSGRAMSDAEVERACAIYRAIRRKTGIGLCASMGLLDQGQLRKLKNAGVERYHCNLETAPSFFPTLCSTHTIEQKLATIRAAQAAGMEVCSGGIIGMGESRAQRIELAVALREAEVVSMPLNILNPIPGTPLEGMAPLPDEEVLLAAAMFRIIHPRAQLRLAGGRVRIAHLVERLLRGGVGAMIVGDMLTTLGSKTTEDMEMLRL